MTSAATTAAAIAGLLTALLGIFRYFNYKTNKDRMAAVGEAFAGVVEGLSSKDDVLRLANAILLRRFLDQRSEFAVRSLVRRKVPYASDAVNVIAAVLRSEPTGNVQKVLADGLAYAPTLASVDLQRTNVRHAYLGAKGDKQTERDHELPSMERTDFFRADLTGASFRQANLQRAVFYEGVVVGTVFTDADLRGADFRSADLKGAQFVGARLAGARFAGAQHLPEGLRARLDENETYTTPDDGERFRPGHASAKDGSPPPAPRIFISTPSVAQASSSPVGQVVVDLLRVEGAAIERVQRSDYSPSSPLRVVTTAMRPCWGVVILGLRQMEVEKAQFRPGTPEQEEMKNLHLPTPWNQLEAGMAAAFGLPLLVVSDCSPGGVFGLGSQGDDVRCLELAESWDVLDVQQALRDWVHALRPPAA